jgi:glyoxylase-like metal-dependent hydrolase (beta-lactamase superfamily II)
MMTPSHPQRRLSRRRFLQIAALTGAGTLAGFGGSLVWSSQALRQFENETVIPLTPWLVNTYLVRGDQPALVDTGFPTDAGAIRRALNARGLLPRDLSLIFITHGHYDHFGAAADLKTGSRVPVSIHADEADRLAAGVPTAVEALTLTGRLISVLPDESQSPAPVTPDVLLADGDRLDAYGLDAVVIHTPGHTDASLSLLINGIAVIGDLMAGNQLYPNLPEYPFFIDERRDQPHIVTSLRRLVDAGAEMFFPGHGLPFDRAAAEGWLEARA